MVALEELDKLVAFIPPEEAAVVDCRRASTVVALGSLEELLGKI